MVIASGATIAAMVATAVAVARALPDGAQLPIHWGIDGAADDFANKWTALMLAPIFTAFGSLLFYFLPVLEPRRRSLEQSQGLYRWGWAAVLVLGATLQLAIVSIALHWPIHAYHIAAGGLGIAFALIGNQLGKSRRMYLFGVRTPWTLASEEVWIKTHRLAGKLMVAGGGAVTLAALLPVPSGVLATTAFCALGAAVGIPVVYSYVLWRREQAVQSSE
jgi:uncharacterized membrane protein